jgi:hypothetical protein
MRRRARRRSRRAASRRSALVHATRLRWQPPLPPSTSSVATASSAAPSVIVEPQLAKPRVYVKNRFVFVRPRADVNADWLGFLWFGSSVELRGEPCRCAVRAARASLQSSRWGSCAWTRSRPRSPRMTRFQGRVDVRAAAGAGGAASLRGVAGGRASHGAGKVLPRGGRRCPSCPRSFTKRGVDCCRCPRLPTSTSGNVTDNLGC